MSAMSGLRTIPPMSLAQAFLETASSRNAADDPPLSPFLMHIARQACFVDLTDDSRRRAEFVFWFLEDLHRRRAPYHWPLPDDLLRWLNAPAIAPRDTPVSADEGQPYLTRFMHHVWEQRRPQVDLVHPIDYLRFLTWFAFDYVAKGNLPRLLLPDDLAGLLRAPVLPNDPPLTIGMSIWTGTARQSRRSEVPTDRAALVASSFSGLTEALAAGDPRLSPQVASAFWSGKVQPESDLTRYEYVAARAHCPELRPPVSSQGAAFAESSRTWFRERYAPRNSNTAIFTPSHNSKCYGADQLETKSAPTAIVVYRDQETICGLSRAGAVTFGALKRASHHVHDVHFNFHRNNRNNIEDEYARNNTQLWNADRVAHILCMNPEYVPECLLCHLGRIAESDYVIGQFYWELSDLGTAHECGLSLVDEIWVASEYLRTLYEKRLVAPVTVMGQVVDAIPASQDRTRESFGLPRDGYCFLAVFDAGSGVERKNPLGLARAFLDAFPSGTEDAFLIIKTKNAAGLHPGRDRIHWLSLLDLASKDARIRVIDQHLSGEDLAALTELCDCYVSLHRSEGFGFGPAEAMARGKPVIVTAYSGVLDFCSPDTALLVDFELTAVGTDSYPYMDPDREYVWADPDLGAASRRMRDLWREPDAGRRLGAAARGAVVERFSADAMARRCRQRLSEIGFLNAEALERDDAHASA